MPVNRKKMRLAYKRWKLCREWVTTTLAFMPEPKRDTIISEQGYALSYVALSICTGEMLIDDPEVQERLVRGLSEQWVMTLWASPGDITKRILRIVWEDIQPELVKHYDAWED